MHRRLQTYAFGHITEKDINDSLKEKTFGKGGDHWKNISMKIRPEGLQGKGNYLAKVLFVTLNILIEVDSGLEVVKNKELWLKDPQVRVNRLDLPDYVTQKALKQIQPLLDLSRIPIPMRLHSVTLEEGAATLRTRNLPEPLSSDLVYRYTAE